MAWAVETLNATVDKELEALPADMRARFVRISNLIAHKRERGSNVEFLHKKWFSDPEYRTAYDKLGLEFEIARAVILARKGAGLTQQQLAQRMNTTQSAVARLEGGHSCPSTSTLMRLALATGTRLKISFETAPRRVTGR